jgi:pilus assembly protein CpaF
VTGGLLDRIIEIDGLADLDPAARRLAIRSVLAPHLEEGEVAGLVEELAERIDGFGPLSPLMRDPSVTDVLVNGPQDIWVERSGLLQPTEVAFEDAADLARFVDRTLGEAGTRADLAWPIADARLRDGSRMHVVLPPIAPDGPLVSIRRFPAIRFELDDLVASRMLSPSDANGLAGAVRERKSILISGATGTGKTTLMNALLTCVGEGERALVIEETPELALPGPNFVRLVARPPNIEGRGEVDLSTLVRTSLRMRPDRIVVGEVRGAEALAALGALTCGHKGSLLTVHARSAADALDRLVALALQARGGSSEESLSRTASRAFDIVVQLDRSSETRRVAEIVEPP